jgi:uncharacterized repeat protein (TIGR01451 family)
MRKRRSLATVGGICALALVGAVTFAFAAGGVTAKITVLNSVTPGGNVGYDTLVSNTGSTVANNVSFTESTGPNGKVVFFSVTTPEVTCTGVGTSTLTCQKAKLPKGASFKVTALFQTDPNAAPGSSLVDTVAGSSSLGAFSASETRTYAANNGGAAVQSLALPNDDLDAGGPGQTSSIDMPGSFVNSLSFAATTLQNLSGSAATPPAVCTTCLSFVTQLTIPTTTTFNTTGPFWDGQEARPYVWTLRLPGHLLPSGFVPSAVWHRDGAGNVVQLPFCARDSQNNPIALRTAPGICVSSLVGSPQSEDIVATGLGLTNGSYWIG